MTWPPAQPAQPAIPSRPWDPWEQPNGLVTEHERLVYVVVDEIVEQWAGLSVSRWPDADQHGRLRFLDPQGAVDVGTSRVAVERFLHPEDPDAAVRVGHTFAATVRCESAAQLVDALRGQAGHGDAPVDDLGDLFERPVLLTDAGRLLAKLATYGALLSTVPETVASAWKLEEEVQET